MFAESLAAEIRGIFSFLFLSPGQTGTKFFSILLISVVVHGMNPNKISSQSETFFCFRFLDYFIAQLA